METIYGINVSKISSLRVHRLQDVLNSRNTPGKLQLQMTGLGKLSDSTQSTHAGELSTHYDYVPLEDVPES